ncbi:hypothetical protein OQA88_647 [Cercophora sp. LCS_1]
MKISLSGWTLFGVRLQLVTAQSPGPDWPNCAAKSRGLSGRLGWEFVNFHHIPYMEGREDATYEVVRFEATNTADGSQISCDMWDPGGANESLVFDSRYFNPRVTDSKCITWWGYEVSTAPESTQTVVIYRSRAREITISQTWTCREDDGQVTTFNSTTTARLDLVCSGDREGGRDWCFFKGYPQGPFAEYTLLSPPATVVSTEGTSVSGPKGIDCLTPTPTWQVLLFWYDAPGPHPKDNKMWPATLYFKLRNLADESHTWCYLKQWVDPSSDFVMRSDGKNCSEGRWSDHNTNLDEVADRAAAEWLWKDVAEIVFDPKTNMLSMNQTWSCPGQGGGNGTVKARGEVQMKMEMTCFEEREKYWLSPVSCKPKNMFDVSESGMLLLGPGRSVVVGED